MQVGYWAEAEEGLAAAALKLLGIAYPRAQDCVDPSWAQAEREAVIQHLERGRRCEAYMGYSSCRICGQDNGCLELTDGVYVWPDGFVHYVRDHAVKPPAEFVAHVMGRKER
jgi:hypothetical protein